MLQGINKHEKEKEKIRRKVNLEIVLEVDLRNDLSTELPFSFMTNKPHTIIIILFRTRWKCKSCNLGRKVYEQQIFTKL